MIGMFLSCFPFPSLLPNVNIHISDGDSTQRILPGIRLYANNHGFAGPHDQGVEFSDGEAVGDILGSA